jgi:glycosyl hydrolase family 65
MRHTLHNDAPPTGLPTATRSVTLPWAPPSMAARAPSASTSTWTRPGPGARRPGGLARPGRRGVAACGRAAGDHRRADELARALQSHRWVQAFQPLGWIEWEHDRAQSGKTSAAYRRSLDMPAAVAVTDAGTAVRLETFVSAVDDVLVARADGAPTAAPLLRSPHPVRTTSSTQPGVTWVTNVGTRTRERPAALRAGRHASRLRRRRSRRGRTRRGRHGVRPRRGVGPGRAVRAPHRRR